ncbi:MAG: helix-turn-helix domain-containing protein, partial [Candidatus Poribacteria bacterium]
DVRIVCATNRNLEERVEQNSFMVDLYDRLNVISIYLPLLRERKEDIPLLVNAFIEEFCQENGKGLKTITSRALRTLMKYDWPGNVRELKNCIEGMVVMSNSSELDLDDLPDRVLKSSGISPSLIFLVPGAESPIPSSPRMNVEVGMSLEEIEKEVIQATLRHAKNNKAKAARILNVSKRTIFRKINQYGLCDN